MNRSSEDDAPVALTEEERIARLSPAKRRLFRLLIQGERKFETGKVAHTLDGKATFGDGVHYLADQTEKDLVCLRPGAGTRPLFCVHDFSCNALVYLDLANRLDAERPVYGIQPRGLDGTQPPLSNIPAMAGHYIQRIHRLQPQGPYNLCGGCFGGIVAFEMARLLIQAGEKVGLVALIETPIPRYSVHYPGASAVLKKRFTGLVRQVQYHWGSLRLLRGRERMLYLRRRTGRATRCGWMKLRGRLRRSGTGFRGTDEPAEHEYLRKVEAGLIESLLSYSPGTYPGRVVLFRGSRRLYGAPPDPNLGWRDVPIADLRIEVINTPPGTILKEPRVRSLVGPLRTYLR